MNRRSGWYRSAGPNLVEVSEKSRTVPSGAGTREASRGTVTEKTPAPWTNQAGAQLS